MNTDILTRLKSAAEAKRDKAIAAADAAYADDLQAIESVLALLPDTTPAPTPPAVTTERPAPVSAAPPRKYGRRVMIGNLSMPFTVEEASAKLGVTVASIRQACAPGNKYHMAGGWPVRWEGEPRPAAEPEQPIVAEPHETRPRQKVASGPINPGFIQSSIDHMPKSPVAVA